MLPTGALLILALALAIGGCGGSDGPTEPARYKIEINNGWPQIEDEKEVDGFLESAWLDPVGPIIAVNTRLSEETGSPMTNAQLARVQTSKMPDYREHEFKRIKLGPHPAIRWAFKVAEEESRIEFFFEECDTTFIVRGSMGDAGFAAFSRSFRLMAETIRADCDE